MRGRKSPIEVCFHNKHIAETATTASNMGIYTVESLKPGLYYFLEDESVVIATCRGCIKMDLSMAELFADELKDIIQDFKSDIQEGRRPMDTRAISKMLEV